jgi:predicted ribosome quality control (RQC) complex YloA/Tae2 family protein
MRIEFNKTWFVIGKSAEDNWKIILQADKEYYWVHANNLPSAHIIIEIDMPTKEEFEYARQLCLNQTKKLNNTTKFITTQISNIKLGSKPGEVYFKDNTKIINI